MISALPRRIAPLNSLVRRLPRALNFGALIAGLGVLGIGFVLDLQGRTTVERRENANVTREINLLRSNLEGRIKGDVHLVRGLIAVIATRPNIDQPRFEELARRLIGDTDHIRAIAAAPDLVVRMVYPLQGNESVLDLDYRELADEWPVVRHAMETGRMVLAGPLDLIEGGQGLIARAPVTTRQNGRDVAWGMVATVIDVPQLFRASGLLDPALPIDVALKGRDGRGEAGEVFFGDPAIFDAEPVTARVELPGGHWVLAATPRGGWAIGGPFGWLPWIAVLALGGLVVVPLTVAARLAAERQRTIAALEDRECELNRLSRRLGLALSASAVGVWEYDIGRNELIWDARMNELYGLPRDKTFHAYSDWRERLHPDDRAEAEALFRSTTQGHARYDTQFRLLLPRGETRHIRAIGAVYTADDGTAKVVGVNWDVTADVVRQSELLAKRREAEAASVAKSRFLATMSHEIRTPMSGVLGMLDLLLESRLGPEQRSRAEIARASAETLLTILDDILDLSKLDADRVQLDPVHMQIDRLLEEVAALFQPMACAKGLSVAVEVAPGMPAWVVCDPVRLRQIVVNLLSNAVKFTDAGGITVRASYHARTARLMIAVEDTGIGIAPDDRARLFQPFSQLEATLDRRSGGTGLGLAISHRLAGMMGGDIAVDSTPGEGSTFTVTLSVPRGSAPDAAAPDARAAHRPLSVLLVEDNKTNQLVVSAMLQRGGHTVALAENGVEALEALDETRFDVVLMDIEMPKMDGPAATARIRALKGPTASIPIIALTANAMAGDRERYLALGMNDYLSKPIDPKALAGSLARQADALATTF